VTYSELLELARKYEGKDLYTHRATKFTVEVRDGMLGFRTSTDEESRTETKAAAERFLERFTLSGNLDPGTYTDVSRNAQFLCGLIKHGKFRSI
jgi:hypothetical protein